jgi:hypothetical protein
LEKALNSLVETASKELEEAVFTNNEEGLDFYRDMLDITSSDPNVWINLLRRLSLACTQLTFRIWWNKQGHEVIDNLCIYANKNPISNIAIALTELVEGLLVPLIQSTVPTNTDLIPLLSDVFNRTTPDASVFRTGDLLLQGMLLQAYAAWHKQWWQIQGKELVKRMSHLANAAAIPMQQQDLSQVQTLLSLAEAVVNNIVTIIHKKDLSKGNHKEALNFWMDVLTELAPLSKDLRVLSINATQVWVDLLEKLWSDIHQQTFLDWWNMEVGGRSSTIRLRVFCEELALNEITLNASKYVYNYVIPHLDKEVEKQERVIRAQDKSTASLNHIHILCDIVLVLLPRKLQETVWTEDRISKLARTFRTDTYPYDAYPWETIGHLLFETWVTIPVLQNSITVCPWLTIHWKELGNLKQVGLPNSWYHVVIRNLVNLSPPDIPASEIVSIVASEPLFEEVLCQCIGNPETTTVAVEFFKLLIDNNYWRKLSLLGKLLLASIQQPTNVEILLRVAGLEKSTDASQEDQKSQRRKEAAELLESHCQEIFKHQPLPPALLALVEEYLTDFDIDSLDLPLTHQFLQILQRTQELGLQKLRENAQGWIELSSLLSGQIQTTEQSLQDVAYHVRKMSRLRPSTKQKLKNKLFPVLTKQVDTMSGLIRVMDNLGPLLFETSDNPGLTLLVSMAKEAVNVYDDPIHPRRQLMYITVFLEQISSIPPSSQKEVFIDDCLKSLLKYNKAEILKLVEAQAIPWSANVLSEWHHYLEREAIDHLRNALQKGDVLLIAKTFDHVIQLSGYPNNALPLNVCELAQSARDLVWAYTNKHDETLLDAYTNISRNPVSQRITIIYPPDLLTHVRKVEQELAIATVMDKYISHREYKSVSALKEIYLSYRIYSLQNSLYTSHQNIQMYQYKEAELKRLATQQRKLREYPQKLPWLVLDDLINDVFIQFFLEQQIDQGKLDSKKTEITQNTIDGFKLHTATEYDNLCKEHRLSQQNVREVLSLFHRKEFFVEKFTTSERALQSWLREKKRANQQNISINYQVLNLKKGLLTQITHWLSKQLLQ